MPGDSDKNTQRNNNKNKNESISNATRVIQVNKFDLYTRFYFCPYV